MVIKHPNTICVVLKHLNLIWADETRDAVVDKLMVDRHMVDKLMVNKLKAVKRLMVDKHQSISVLVGKYHKILMQVGKLRLILREVICRLWKMISEILSTISVTTSARKDKQL